MTPRLRQARRRSRLSAENGAGPRESDRGSAVAEFVMVAGLLVLLLAGSLQIGFALHVRNTVQDAAAAGARYGTLRDRSPEDGVRRTRDIIGANLPSGYAENVSYRVVPATTSAGQLEIVVSTRLPVVLSWGPDHAIEVSGHAILPSDRG